MEKVFVFHQVIAFLLAKHVKLLSNQNFVKLVFQILICHKIDALRIVILAFTKELHHAFHAYKDVKLVIIILHARFVINKLDIKNILIIIQIYVSKKIHAFHLAHLAQ